MNLGGPEKTEDVNSFLFNLFYDRAIINLPTPLRWVFAKLISFFRGGGSKKLYECIGGGSPLLKITTEQARCLKSRLRKEKKDSKEYGVFVSMRYWHPFSYETIKEVEKFCPDEIILLPLYPQFSTTTSQSSIRDFCSHLELSKIKGTTVKLVDSFFDNKLFIDAHVKLIKEAITSLGQKPDEFVVIFSAHSLPLSIIKRGDPYKEQTEKTVGLISKKLPGIKTRLGYQSKIGPVKWLGPDTRDEIIKVASEGKSIILVPIAFVSEHLETLVELDIEYKNIARERGVKGFHRVRALGTEELFIDSLADLCLKV